MRVGRSGPSSQLVRRAKNLLPPKVIYASTTAMLVEKYGHFTLVASVAEDFERSERY
jgi:hypothetical protein